MKSRATVREMDAITDSRRWTLACWWKGPGVLSVFRLAQTAFWYLIPAPLRLADALRWAEGWRADLAGVKEKIERRRQSSKLLPTRGRGATKLCKSLLRRKERHLRRRPYYWPVNAPDKFAMNICHICWKTLLTTKSNFQNFGTMLRRILNIVFLMFQSRSSVNDREFRPVTNTILTEFYITRIEYIMKMLYLKPFAMLLIVRKGTSDELYFWTGLKSCLSGSGFIDFQTVYIVRALSWNDGDHDVCWRLVLKVKKWPSAAAWWRQRLVWQLLLVEAVSGQPSLICERLRLMRHQ